MSDKWLYVRVKRRRTTVFLHVDLQQTVLEVKGALQEYFQKDPKCMKLYREQTELQDASKLASCLIENDDVLALALAEAEGGDFDSPDIAPYEDNT